MLVSEAFHSLQGLLTCKSLLNIVHLSHRSIDTRFLSNELFGNGTETKH